MKKSLFLFVFIIVYGLKTSLAASLGTPEILILIFIGVFSVAFALGLIFLCLYLINKLKLNRNEK